MNSPFACLAVPVSIIAIGCSNAVAPVARTIPDATHAPTNPRPTGHVSAGVRLTELSGAATAPMTTAPGLTYSAESSEVYIHTTDRGAVVGRMKIAVVKGDTEAETTDRLRSIDYLEKALRGTGMVDVDISVDRAQPFDAISTDAPILLAGSGPRGARAERYARELAKYAHGGGLIIGSAPGALAQNGTWFEVADDHPLLNVPYRIEKRRRGGRALMLVVDGRVVAVSSGTASASAAAFRLTGDEVKRWVNLFAYAAGPRQSGMSLARTRAAEEVDDTSIDPPRYLSTLTPTPKRIPKVR